jgi:hypothetical protein
MSKSFTASPSYKRFAPVAAIALGFTFAMVVPLAGCKSSKSTGAGDGGTSGSGGSKTGGTGGSSGKSGGGGSGGMCASNAGGPVSGDADKHCIDSSGAEIKQPTSEAACNNLDAGPSAASDDGGAEEQAPILFNSEGDDDDCKYHVKWTASCVEENKNVTFTATITKKADGKPLTGAASSISLDVYVGDASDTPTHIAPDTKQMAKETSSGSGQYTIGPIRFDAAGKWTVRFHMRETCADIDPESPHGHVAFFVNVP